MSSFTEERELKFDAAKPVKHVRFLALWFRDAPVHESRCLVAHCPFIICEEGRVEKLIS